MIRSNKRKLNHSAPIKKLRKIEEERSQEAQDLINAQKESSGQDEDQYEYSSLSNNPDLTVGQKLRLEMLKKTGKLRDYRKVAKKELDRLTKLHVKPVEFNPRSIKRRIQKLYKKYIKHNDKIKTLVKKDRVEDTLFFLDDDHNANMRELRDQLHRVQVDVKRKVRLGTQVSGGSGT